MFDSSFLGTPHQLVQERLVRVNRVNWRAEPLCEHHDLATSATTCIYDEAELMFREKAQDVQGVDIAPWSKLLHTSEKYISRVVSMHTRLGRLAPNGTELSRATEGGVGCNEMLGGLARETNCVSKVFPQLSIRVAYLQNTKQAHQHSRPLSDSTTATGAVSEACGVLVSIFVPDEHPLMRLKRALDWEAITQVMVRCWHQAGKNVAGGPGRWWPISLYVPLLVLMWIKTWHSRQMEEYISESVVARRFLDLTEPPMLHLRDHSNIDRAERAIDAAGRAEINALIIKTAAATGFTDGKMLSSDTTVQEPAIGYPNEPGMVKGWAERIERNLKKLARRGVKVAKVGIEQAKEIYRSVKAHHLWAKTKEAKEKVPEQIVQQSRQLIETTKEAIQPVSGRGGPAKQNAVAGLKRMVEVARQLIPQIQHWMKTGRVAGGKIIHLGIPEARAIVKG